MKDCLKALAGIALIVSIVFVNGLNALDKPMQSCDEYIEENNLNEEVCK